MVQDPPQRRIPGRRRAAGAAGAGRWSASDHGNDGGALNTMGATMGGKSMKSTMHGIGKAAGALALAGSVLVATALPAAAASPNRAYGASAGGLISHGPIGQATFPGTSPVTVANASIAGLLTTGIAHYTAGANRTAFDV